MIIRSDQLYEERGVDVKMDHRSSFGRSNKNESEKKKYDHTGPKVLKSSHKTKDHTTDNRHGAEVLIQIKRPQDGGTVRSIPIKDYQASIAQNFGTLRKSAVPQQQFESLVSEPEKTSRQSGKKKMRESLKNIRSSEEIEVIQNHKPIHEDSDDFADLNEYFHKEAIDDSMEKHREHRTKESEVDGATKKQEMADLRRGHVGKKISVYEETSRGTKQERDSKRRFSEVKRKTIGVPLVGMHNACGLPVIAPWPDHVLKTIRMPNKLVETLGSISKRRHSINPRSRTHPKRKAPQPNSTLSKAVILQPRQQSNGVPVNCRMLRRPSYRIAKNNTLPIRNTTLRRRSSKSEIKKDPVSTLGRKSLKRRSAKRTTLYARDDGVEAVKALKDLCLNPLARTKGDAHMIW